MISKLVLIGDFNSKFHTLDKTHDFKSGYVLRIEKPQKQWSRFLKWTAEIDSEAVMAANECVITYAFFSVAICGSVNVTGTTGLGTVSIGVK